MHVSKPTIIYLFPITFCKRVLFLQKLINPSLRPLVSSEIQQQF